MQEPGPKAAAKAAETPIPKIVAKRWMRLSDPTTVRRSNAGSIDPQQISKTENRIVNAPMIEGLLIDVCKSMSRELSDVLFKSPHHSFDAGELHQIIRLEPIETRTWDQLHEIRIHDPGILASFSPERLNAALDEATAAATKSFLAERECRKEEALEQARLALKQMREKKEPLQQLERRMQEGRRTLLEAGLLYVDPARVIGEMMSELRNADPLPVRHKARREATQRMIDELQHQVEKRVQDSELLQELQNIIRLRTMQFEAAAKLVHSGVESSTTLDKIEESLSQAKVERVRQRMALQAASGGDQIGKLYSQSTDLAIAEAEVKAKKEFLSDRLKRADRIISDPSFPMDSLKGEAEMRKLQSAINQFKEQLDRMNNYIAKVEKMEIEFFKDRPAELLRKPANRK